MVIQSFVFPNDVCSETGLFYRNEAEIEISKSENSEFLIINGGNVLSNDTYMNFFDKSFWKRYTYISKVELMLQLMGKGVVDLYEDNVLSQTVPFQFDFPTEIRFNLDMQTEGNCFFKIRVEERTMLYKASFLANEEKRPPEDVKLAILICTYKREQVLTDNFRRLENSLFFKKDSSYFGKMFFYVTDNASTLRAEDITGTDSASQDMANHLCLRQNENLGGSGGFKKCILEMRQNHEQFPSTHAVFMDDDIQFIPETFYRLYALLSYMRPEYRSEVISGRMFRMDQKNIQYTASEIWNNGNLIHMGFQEDMCNKENLLSCNEKCGEYAGWWFAVYPYSFVAENLPLPFFLHCDDVEYGLRHKGTPIVLNGLQVWHDTYENRSSPEITYYDRRNCLTVNALYGLLPEKKEFLTVWKDQITKAHIAKNYLEEHMLILAMRDFLKGKRYFLRRDVQKEHRKIMEAAVKPRIKQKNRILWRLAAARINLFYEYIVKTYIR